MTRNPQKIVTREPNVPGASSNPHTHATHTHTHTYTHMQTSALEGGIRPFISLASTSRAPHTSDTNVLSQRNTIFITRTAGRSLAAGRSGWAKTQLRSLTQTPHHLPQPITTTTTITAATAALQFRPAHHVSRCTRTGQRRSRRGGTDHYLHHHRHNRPNSLLAAASIWTWTGRQGRAAPVAPIEMRGGGTRRRRAVPQGAWGEWYV